jgi:hypothetical protein
VPQPDIVRRRSGQLIQAYREAWRDIIRQQRLVAADPARYARQARLVEMRASIERILSELDEKAAEWFANELPKIYASGGRATAAALGEQMTWSLVHQAAVKELAEGTFDDLLKATRYVRTDTKRFIRDAGRYWTQLVTTTDRTAQGAAREMFKDLVENHGIHAVRYKDGSRHGLLEYSRMAIRSKSAIAYNVGGLNVGDEFGVIYYECFDGPGCGWTFHGSPDQALGKIVTRDEALGNPISHPNCRRAFGPRPDLRTKKQAKAAQGGQVTDEQTAAQRAADERRRRRRR